MPCAEHFAENPLEAPCCQTRRRRRAKSILWERLAVGRAVRRAFRRKSSGSAMLSDAPPPPREEQTPRAGGHAGTPCRADRRASDTRPAGAGDGPPPTPTPDGNRSDPVYGDPTLGMLVVKLVDY